MLGGVFRRLLIANRGEVVVRVARACRELGIEPVGVASEADRDASWTESLAEVVCVGPAAAAESYLVAERLVQAARQTHCAAVHPGWGFLAEDAGFAALCRQYGLAFVGPPAGLIERMAEKSAARAAMRAAGLAVLPGSPGPLADLEEALACAREVGFPVLLKAERGGGGRGMRRCADEDELRRAWGTARAEARAAFGSGELLLERWVESGRHVEIQVLCDAWGTALALGERECSIQRRHQKLLEESPSPALAPAERERLEEGARRAAAAIGYVGAGTLEFLRAPAGELFFLEMNTRLQVEHGVTEMVRGVDIVREQIRVAANERLDPRAAGAPEGAAIECRINAEDPAADFRPSPGRLRAFSFPTDLGPGRVRVDTHLRAGDEVLPHYDSLLAKVIAHAPTREAAIETLASCLAHARVEGVATTLPLHRAVLASEDFRRGAYDTSRIPGWEGAA